MMLNNKSLRVFKVLYKNIINKFFNIETWLDKIQIIVVSETKPNKMSELIIRFESVKHGYKRTGNVRR